MQSSRRKKLWIVFGVALLAALAALAVAMLIPGKHATGHSDDIGGFVAAMGGMVAAISAAAARRQRDSRDKQDG
jgi:threonine/homoserine efflux transporter RhtA